jgi:glucosamine--fructose-6-phosphate aminotransferase (isomerizing)
VGDKIVLSQSTDYQILDRFFTHSADYTDREREEQLSHLLITQTHMAPKFVENSWDYALNSARSAIDRVGNQFTEVIIAGCGDSYYAGLGLELAFHNWTNLQTRAGPSLKVGRYLLPSLLNLDHKALVIGISASGEVARTIEVVDLAKQVGATTLAFTADPESSLAELADASLSLPIPEIPHGPGLLTYLGSVLLGYSLCATLASDFNRNVISSVIDKVPMELESWIPVESRKGIDHAENEIDRGAMVFLGAGPDHSSAMFSAAKVVESCGVSAWGQDTEEWAHIEYFSEPADMFTWILSSGGRSRGREIEIEAAAKGIGRRLVVSRWEGWSGLGQKDRESVSPLFLWVGPTAFAAKLAEILGEVPFRGFEGGRSVVEGGGISRIRSSQRVESVNELTR